ncbi:MAG TPA: hypothetical protein VHB78_16755 [Vicinamibacterales bacterium]|jgi:hypothetical protein|nr:hypothetical protein [Vicinamibacterales bacterium]
MTPATITLRVPAGAPFQALAVAAACRFGELCGTPAAEAPALEQAVTRAVATVAGTADHLDLSCTCGPAGVDIALSAGGRHQVVHHPIS